MKPIKKKLACGCKTIIQAFGQHSILEKTEYCNYHTKEIKEKNKRIKENFKTRLKQTTEEIKCEICHKHICWVDASDLNCSYFICDFCKDDNKSRKTRKISKKPS